MANDFICRKCKWCHFNANDMYRYSCYLRRFEVCDKLQEDDNYKGNKIRQIGHPFFLIPHNCPYKLEHMVDGDGRNLQDETEQKAL